ncbi:glutathione S-transferase [Litorimonas taeanensis]|uniref:Glutathione S-transferase n=1 Tax=Litorimonas taeanensis TaxID=568099 RepID=A0A420WJM2_9PROT|nr:glutathione S-transferase N-terminal domain-containing protein [Litorimonas taeanensis]RKQ71231.1 glutathione S-transferase [Litorimonas taeanensis]
MSALTLFIGNYNYSSWSLRPWMVLRKAELPFDEEVIDLDIPGYKDKLLALSDEGTVPVLRVNDDYLPDSLAICEFAAKAVPNLWPKDAGHKALALEAVEKMHTGFEAIRREAPMNLRRRTSTKMPQDCLDDAAEICALWDDLLSRHDGPYLFNEWSIADAFYMPVATRFTSYDLPRSVRSDTYISELMSDEDYLEWEMRAFAEDHVLPETDAVNR